MNNDPIEDIMINSYKNTKKKGRGILVVFFFLMILLILACAAYYYLTTNTVQPSKQLFFSAILNTDYDFYIDNQLYNEIINKYTKNNSQTEANITFSTTMKQPNEVEDIDFSKFALDINFINNINTSEAFGEFSISYSDNELLKLKVINNKEQFAWTSDEIVNKYVAVNKANSERVLNQINTSISEMKAMTEGQITENNTSEGNIVSQEETSESVDVLSFTKNVSEISKKEISLEKNEKIKEYLNFISNNIAEEKFSMQTNYALERENSENISVTAYTLKLNQQEYVSLVKKVLEKLKQDSSIIEEIVTGESSKKTTELDLTTNASLDPVGTNNITNNAIAANTIDSSENPTSNPNQIEAIANQVEENIIEDNSTIVENDTNTITEENENTIQTANKITVTPIIDNDSKEEVEETKNIIDLNQFFISLLLNRKFEATVEEVQNTIDYYLEKISNDGNGLQVTVYVSENATEKINIILPNSATVDLEFTSKSDEEKNVILTYLIEEEVVKYDEENAVVYSAFDNTVSEVVPGGTEKQMNGFKLDFYKLKSEASTKIKLIYNFIENKEINKKISLNLVTDGTSSSKNFENEFVIIYSSNEGEIKTTIENQIKFGVNKTLEVITDENSVVLDTMTDEDLKMNVDAIRDKIKTVYDSKKESLNFIDTNMQTSLIQNTTFVTRDEARNLLVTTISTKMGEAQNRGEQYILKNLENLEIAGHQVNVEFENELAIVTVDGYKFEIDSNFNLSDA